MDIYMCVCVYIYLYINGVSTDTNGCMKMVMTTATSVATVNDESVG